MNVTLTPHFDEFIRRQLDSGRYHSASELIREALRLLEDRERQIERLRDDLQKGLDSSPARPVDIERIKQKGRKRLASMK